MGRSTARDERLYVRADSATKERVVYAAELCHLSVSEFVRSAIEDRVEDVMASRQRTILEPADFDALVAALDAPVTPSRALQEAAARPRQFIQK